MDRNDELLRVIGDIYDASLNPACWSEALQHAVAFAGAQSCGLLTQTATGEVQIGYTVGVEPDFLRSYIDNYGRLDPMPAVRHAPIGRIHTTTDWVAMDEFRNSTFYREWAAPQGLEDGINALIDRSADGFSYFGLMSADRVDRTMHETFASLLPHLRRAILINDTMQARRAPQSPAIDALDALAAAVFLLAPSGQITHANASARELLLATTALRSISGRLVATEPGVDHILREAVAASAHGDRAVKGESSTLLLSASDGTRYLGHVLPLLSGARRTFGTAHEATTMLLVREATLDTRSVPGVLQTAFRLTPAELRILLAVVDIGGVGNVARHLDVAESTVKTHLKRIFAKTDTRRQAELVRLVAAFASPVVA